MAETGIRLNEVVNLRIDDWSPRGIKIRGLDREFSLTEKLCSQIRQYIPLLPEGARCLFFGANRYGFQSERMSPRAVELVFKRYSRLSDCEDFKPRSLRHFAAINWLRNGLTEAEVKSRLGLKSDSSMFMYREILKNHSYSSTPLGTWANIRAAVPYPHT